MLRKPSASKEITTDLLLEVSNMDIDAIFQKLKSNNNGLTKSEVTKRRKIFGKNTIIQEGLTPWYLMLIANIKDPFVIVLIIIGFVSYLTKDFKSSILVATMALIAIFMRFFQEYRSTRTAEVLRKQVRTHATVKRHNKYIEEPIEDLVPGDIIYVSAGDMIPADCRLITSKDLFVSQAALTGESIPVEKSVMCFANDAVNLINKNTLCFMGTSVVSGFGEAIIINTGMNTYFGELAKDILNKSIKTNFDKGIYATTMLMIKFIIVIIPIVFFINGWFKHDWTEAFLFSIAVIVGITPEMLPMIVTSNLAKGAVAMSKYKVIVKRIDSIQSFGAMNILCIDKTGTLTQNHIILEKYLDISGISNPQVLEYFYLNSHFQSGVKNMFDVAVMDTMPSHSKGIIHAYIKIDEIPYDFTRRRMSVILQKNDKECLLICKGSTDKIVMNCSTILTLDGTSKLTPEHAKSISYLEKQLCNDGFHTIAVAFKNISQPIQQYEPDDENELVFLGITAFLDPPKETAKDALKSLYQNNVEVKILTGDNEIITKHICNDVEFPYKEILLGAEMDSLTDEQLSNRAKNISIFANLLPLQKARVIRILKDNGNVVGYLGDGINDAAALQEADVGISVDSATDIARESASIILLEKSLLVLNEGVIQGRNVYGNIIKYIKMTLSSNFGNTLSILIASSFLPFLPMQPLQIILQNLLYDFSQLATPWDKMDIEFLQKPHDWDPRRLITFMLCIGPLSSVFDIIMFSILWFIFGANDLAHQTLFQTGWFVEGLLTQTLIIHVIRTTKIPFIQSCATIPLLTSTIVIMCIGVLLPFSPIGSSIKLVPLPANYFMYLASILVGYYILVLIVKKIYIRHFNNWL